ncbi:MAG TPA: SRPBCC domain-containing protein [Dehalococcoidia bacterium]|nr:SRPBCC domain-containing protein [Dehalococcoidia bacterium]
MQANAAPIEIRRVIAAPVDDVFAAWVDPASMREWFNPFGRAAMTADFREGGSFRLVMSDEHLSVEHTGVYRVIDPPNRLVFTWRSQYTGNRDTLVSIHLFPLGDDQTELVLTHELLPSDEVEPHTGGWTQILEQLDAYLRSSASRSHAPRN